MPVQFNSIARIKGHTAHARLLQNLGMPIGYIPRADLPSPFAYSPTDEVYSFAKTGVPAKRVILRETSHGIRQLFEVPDAVRVYADEATAEDAFSHPAKYEQTIRPNCPI